MNISRPTLNWFKNYLESHKQITEVNGTESSELTIDCGVPQGSILGPLIFILYINNLPSALVDSNTYMYADDMAIVCRGKSLDGVNLKLSVQLKNALEWLNDHKLTFNLNKTQVDKIRCHIGINTAIYLYNTLIAHFLHMMIMYMIPWALGMPTNYKSSKTVVSAIVSNVTT